MLYLFDIDGTLTPSRQPMDDTFAAWWRKRMFKKPYAFVTGSDYAKIQEQIPEDILMNAQRVYACSGNSVYEKGVEISRNEWEPSKDLLDFLDHELEFSEWKHPTSNHIEIRTGLVNFSTIGRDCSQEERERYFLWDQLTQERLNIRQRLLETFPDLNCEIGGEISIDIYPKGCDKSQIVKHLWRQAPIYFYGDGILPGRNDYTLACALDTPSQSFPVETWVDTWDALGRQISTKKA